MITPALPRWFGAALAALAVLSEAVAQETKTRVYENRLTPLHSPTPLLADHCATGNILPKVYIVYDKPVGDKQDNYFRIYVKDALITSVQLSGSNENPTESVSFARQTRAL